MLASFLSQRRRRPQHARNMVAEVLEQRCLLATISLDDLSIDAHTGEKPQSKVWQHDQQWWSVLPDSSGTWLWRLAGSNWTKQLQLSGNAGVEADIRATAELAHVLLFDGSDSQYVTLEYSAQSHTYDFWSDHSAVVDVSLSSGVETATIERDSTGRLWIASDATSRVEVRYSDAPYTDWSEPITVASGIGSDDISAITAFGNDRIGVIWSNQETERFGFRYHVDGTSPQSWSSVETPAAGSLSSFGGGMADDHLNFAAATDGTIYVAVKTSYSGSSATTIGLLERSAAGDWSDLHQVDTGGTRPIAVVDEARNVVLVAYTTSNSGGDIVYRESPRGSINFGSRQTLIDGNYNNVTSTRQPVHGQVVFLASGGSQVVGAMLTADETLPNQPPVVHAGADQVVYRNEPAQLQGQVQDDGLPSSSSLSYQWSVISGPGEVTFGDRFALGTQAAMSQPGEYLLRLTADDGEFTTYDELIITASSAVGPQAVSFRRGMWPDENYTGTRDTSLFEEEPTANFGSQDVLEVDGSPLARGLLYWDISAIPAGSTIVSASVMLDVTNTTSDEYFFYALARPWEEHEATWQQATDQQAWSAAGASSAADIHDEALTQIVADETGPQETVLDAAGLARLQAWVDDPTSNHGLAIRGAANASNGFDFIASEHADISRRPALAISYLPPDPNTPRVVGRHLFYNDSQFDGNDPAASAADDQAIAPDKAALLPGETSSFANVSSYVHGINGMMIDVANLPDEALPSAADVQLRHWPVGGTASWTAAPPPTSVEVRRGAGLDGSDRLTLLWDNGTIVGGWLEVRLLAGEHTGLSQDDLFYFASLPGDAGNSSGIGQVNASDYVATRRAVTDAAPAPLGSRHDFNRDGMVDQDDLQLIASSHTTLQSSLPVLDLIFAETGSAGEPLVAEGEGESLLSAEEAQAYALAAAHWYLLQERAK